MTERESLIESIYEAAADRADFLSTLDLFHPTSRNATRAAPTRSMPDPCAAMPPSS